MPDWPRIGKAASDQHPDSPSDGAAGDGELEDGYGEGDSPWSPGEYFSPEGIKGRWAGEHPSGDGPQGSSRNPTAEQDGTRGGPDEDTPPRSQSRDRTDWTAVLRRRRGAIDDLWPDDGISDKDYGASAAVDRPLLQTLSLPVTIYIADEAIHEQVETAVENFLAAAGLDVMERDDPVIGSWFHSMMAGVRQAAHSSAAREVALSAAHSVDSRVNLAQDAVVTATLLQNLGPVVASLQPTKDAVLRVGALLIVKVDWAVQVLQLTAAQQAVLDHNVFLASSPSEIIKALQVTVDQISDYETALNALEVQESTTSREQ